MNTGWIVAPTAHCVHVVPVDDEFEHIVEDEGNCWCDPVVGITNWGQPLFTHQAADMRQWVERAEKIKETVEDTLR